MILGIDPGSRTTGFGLLRYHNRQLGYIDSGCIRTGGGELPARLKVIFTEVQRLIQLYRPTVVAVEQVFMYRNPDSALKLGQARGSAICAAVVNEVAVVEYSPNAIKQSVVGHGHAEKAQVQQMVTQLLQLNGSPQSDAADALAVAICHAHTQQVATKMAALHGVAGRRQRRWR